jgi:lysophospholipase L1-like esterase
MLDCLIVGDSIAVGTQQFKPECQLVGKGGINSWQWNKTYAKDIKPSEAVIISLGSNDHSGVNTFQELMKVRQRIEGKRVYWIMPHGNNPKSNVDILEIQAIVDIIAKNFGDTVLPITHVQKDNIHPSWAGYKQIAKEIK